MTNMPGNYRKYTLDLLAVTVVALAVCGVGLAQKQRAVPAQASPEQNVSEYYSSKPGASQENGRNTSAEETPAPSPPAPYLITAYRGKIGVFQKGESTPLLTADIVVAQLPEEDRALLRQGIPAASMQQVKSILEDYE